MSETLLLRSEAAPREIRNGVIYGASVITSGEIKGHGLWADRKTLDTVKRCAEGFSSGVKVKIDHGSGFENIVGSLRSFRISESQLLADLHLLKAHPWYESILEIAQTMPATFGLSVSMTGEKETIADKTYFRCIELYSVDLVDHPAANPNGLFSQPMQSRISALENEVARAAGAAHLQSLYRQHGIDPNATTAEALLAKLGLLELSAVSLGNSQMISSPDALNARLSFLKEVSREVLGAEAPKVHGTVSEQIDAIEEALWRRGLTVPGMNEAHIEARQRVPRRELKGLARTERAFAQARVDAVLKKHLK